MKKNTQILIAIISIFSLGSYAQPSNLIINKNQLIAENQLNDDVAVISYHVEERINMAFGSNITTYDVSSLSLVSTNDLGENNVRIITPKYAKAKPKIIPIAVAPSSLAPIYKEVPVAAMNTIDITKVEKFLKVDALATEAKEKYATIDVLGTYERILDKGYKSPDMLKRVANSRYFEGDLITAAKWYAQLFALTNDFDSVYYYRYAQALKAINQLEKAKEMMVLFESKNL